MLVALATGQATAAPLTVEQLLANAQRLGSVATPRCRDGTDRDTIIVCARRLADTHRSPVPDERDVAPPSRGQTPSEAERTCAGKCTGSLSKVIGGLLAALRGD